MSSYSSLVLSQLAIFAILGQVVLSASAWLLPIVSEYSLVSDNISELVLGRYGFIQTAAFLIAGFGTLALAFALRQITKHAWGSRVGSLLVAMYGLGPFFQQSSPPIASIVRVRSGRNPLRA